MLKLNELQKVAKLLNQGIGGDVTNCCICGVLLQETITGARKVRDGHVCSDCYFELLNEAVERSPVSKHAKPTNPSTKSVMVRSVSQSVETRPKRASAKKTQS